MLVEVLDAEIFFWRVNGLCRLSYRNLIDVQTDLLCLSWEMFWLGFELCFTRSSSMFDLLECLCGA